MNDIGNKAALEEDNYEERAYFFEDAIALTGHGRYHYVLLLGAGSCLISLIFVSINTSYLLPSAQCDFDMTTQDKGVLNAALFIGMMSSSHLWGFLADTQGRRNILMFTLCCDAAITIISSFAHTFIFFLFCRFLNGFFICGPSAVVYAYLGEFHPKATRTRVIIWAGVLLSFGTVALPAVAWLVIPQPWTISMPWHTVYNSWRIFVAICALPSLFTAAILGFCLTESPKFLLARGKTEKALEVLRYVYSVNTGKHPDTYQVKRLQMDPNEEVVTLRVSDPKDKWAVLKVMYDQTAPLFQTPHLKKTLLACFIQFGLYTSCNGFLLWVPDIFNRQAEYASLHPNSSATVCGMITSLGAPTLDLQHNATGGHVHATGGHVHATGGHVHANGTLPLVVDECVSYVDPFVFQGALIIGMSSSVAYIFVGLIVNHVRKKNILVSGLLLSAAAGIGLYFVSASIAILVLSTMFVVFSGLCISVLNSAVIEVYPTHLRAMAVCISLMFGRVGTVFGTLLMGVLLDINCATVFFILSGVVLVCGLLSCVFPSPSSQTSEKVYKIND